MNPPKEPAAPNMKATNNSFAKSNQVMLAKKEHINPKRVPFTSLFIVLLV
jgi:negative regulator of replication initiation